MIIIYWVRSETVINFVYFVKTTTKSRFNNSKNDLFGFEKINEYRLQGNIYVLINFTFNVK